VGERLSLQKWCVQSTSNRMIGIGIPIRYKRMERMVELLVAPRRKENEPVSQRFPDQSASAAVAGSA
jgi:hypothetical protein